jgi:hypothetical protein
MKKSLNTTPESERIRAVGKLIWFYVLLSLYSLQYLCEQSSPHEKGFLARKEEEKGTQKVGEHSIHYEN